MALKSKSLFLYGFQVTENNRSIDFQNVGAGPELQASLTLGFYSLTSLMIEVKSQMQVADPANTYTVTADRTILSGTENRVSVATSGAFLSILNGTGSRAASAALVDLAGFPAADETGSTTYTGTSSAGTTLQPVEIGYNYLPPTNWRQLFGNVNISASGIKEAIVFNIQKFWQVQFKYEPELLAQSDWTDLADWMIQQKPLEFTPDITNAPSTVLEGSLETTTANNKGLAWKMVEMLPDFPFLYDTGLMTFRLKEA